jgi:hypothetical protein
VGGLAGSSGLRIGARFAQGAAAAMILPALDPTTTFKEDRDRHTALGVWAGVGRA